MLVKGLRSPIIDVSVKKIVMNNYKINLKISEFLRNNVEGPRTCSQDKFS